MALLEDDGFIVDEVWVAVPLYCLEACGFADNELELIFVWE